MALLNDLRSFALEFRPFQRAKVAYEVGCSQKDNKEDEFNARPVQIAATSCERAHKYSSSAYIAPFNTNFTVNTIGNPKS